jgi:hypothetical protein
MFQPILYTHIPGDGMLVHTKSEATNFTQTKQMELDWVWVCQICKCCPNPPYMDGVSNRDCDQLILDL